MASKEGSPLSFNQDTNQDSPLLFNQDKNQDSLVKRRSFFTSQSVDRFLLAKESRFLS